MSQSGLFLLFFLLLSSCTAQHVTHPNSSVQNQAFIRERLSFEAAVYDILAAKCLDCHSGQKIEGDVDLTNYESLLKGKAPVVVPGQPDSSLLIKVILSNEMPKDSRPRITEEELSYLRAWILSRESSDSLSGTPHADPPPIFVGDMGPITFEKVYREIFEPKCSQCHAGASAEDFVDLTSLEEIKNNFMYSDLIVKGNPSASRIYRAVESGRMPRRGLKLSESELMLLRLWIFEGPDLL